MSQERIQKILAQAGIASRRKAEDLISEGLVTVNGKVAKLGDKAEVGKDAIKVKGKLLQKPKELIYVVLNKPKGVICSLADPDNRPSLATYLDALKTRVFPIGRLDFNSDGLLILTNDGNFAEKVQKRDDIPRVYSVKVKGLPDEEMLARLGRAARMGGTGVKNKLVKPYSVRLLKKLESKSIIQIVIMGGSAFDIKAFFESRGFSVEKVSRTAVGHITLKSLLPGEYRLLKASQAFALLEQPELALKVLAVDKKESRHTTQRKIHARPGLSPKK
jgi:23S rRNA pseudouridine2605 synthase